MNKPDPEQTVQAVQLWSLPVVGLVHIASFTKQSTGAIAQPAWGFYAVTLGPCCTKEVLKHC